MLYLFYFSLFTGFDHLWLSEIEIISSRQQLAPKIDVAVKEIERLLVAVINIKEVIIYTGSVESSQLVENVDSNPEISITEDNSININDDNNVISDISKIEMIQEIWSKYRSKGAPPTVIEKDDNKNNYPESYDTGGDSKNSKKRDKEISKSIKRDKNKETMGNYY